MRRYHPGLFPADEAHELEALVAQRQAKVQQLANLGGCCWVGWRRIPFSFSIRMPADGHPSRVFVGELLIDGREHGFRSPINGYPVVQRRINAATATADC